MKPFKKIICYIFGHIPTEVNRNKCTAVCKRCRSKLRIFYDMMYGETVVIDK